MASSVAENFAVEGSGPLQIFQVSADFRHMNHEVEHQGFFLAGGSSLGRPCPTNILVTGFIGTNTEGQKMMATRFSRGTNCSGPPTAVSQPPEALELIVEYTGRAQNYPVSHSLCVQCNSEMPRRETENYARTTGYQARHKSNRRGSLYKCGPRTAN